MLIQVRRSSDVRPSEITPELLYLRRREFLRGAVAAVGALAGGALCPGCTSAEESDTRGEVTAAAFPAARNTRYATTDAQTSYEDATSYNNFYEFGTDKGDPARAAHQLITSPWSVTIAGQVGKPGVVPLEDLLKPHALEERVYRLRCVEAWSMVIPWIGIPLGEVLNRFEPTSLARYVEFRTLHDPEHMPGQRSDVLEWPYREGLTIAEAMHPLTILAVGMYGRVLPNQNGAPLRLVVPWKYGFKSIKSIVSMNLTGAQPNTSWNDATPGEYGFYANVNPEVDHPRWSQKQERRIGEFRRRPTLPFNGYAEEVAGLYTGLDLHKHF